MTAFKIRLVLRPIDSERRKREFVLTCECAVCVNRLVRVSTACLAEQVPLRVSPVHPAQSLVIIVIATRTRAWGLRITDKSRHLL